MKKNKKAEFLDQLRKVPIILAAAEKCGLSRQTIYRWRDEDKQFAKDLEKALEEGEEFINSMSESQLITLIKEKNWGAIRFRLNHCHPKYKTRIEIDGTVNTIQELSPEQKELVRKALSMANLNQDGK